MPPRDYRFWVYILASRSRNLYIGITSNLPARTATHRESAPGTHTAYYAIHRLVYYEFYRYVRSALTREKELKHWTRAQKIALIESMNPTWEDLLPPRVKALTHLSFALAPLSVIPAGNLLLLLLL